MIYLMGYFNKHQTILSSRIKRIFLKKISVNRYSSVKHLNYVSSSIRILMFSWNRYLVIKLNKIFENILEELIGKLPTSCNSINFCQREPPNFTEWIGHLRIYFGSHFAYSILYCSLPYISKEKMRKMAHIFYFLPS